MKKRLPRPVKIFSAALIIGTIGIVGLYGLACCQIGIGVKKISNEAIQIYQGDKVEALINFMNSEGHPLPKRNHAIWALGQLGDKRALPSLEKLYTGEPCDHSKYVCQDELKKAIKLCRGELNISAWTWRRFVLSN